LKKLKEEENIEGSYMLLMVKPLICIIICVLTILVPLKENEMIILAEENNVLFTEKIDILLNQHPYLKGAIAGVSVRSASTGQLIYSFNGDKRLTPASNLKLFTAAAALTTLGQDYTFQTELLTDGSIKWNVLTGNLYLKGKGDPTLLPGDYDQFAKELKKKGVKMISGDLIGDDSWYDDVRYSVDVTWSDEEAYYGAQISALTVSPDQDFDSGTIIVEVTPGKNTNQKANITVSPKTDYVQIINDTKTVESDGRNEISISRDHGQNIIRINGTIPIDAPTQKELVAIWEPTKYALHLFKQSLKKQGIKILGKMQVEEVPKKTNLIFSHSSMPLSQLLVPFMKLSNNGHGDILIKEMGKAFKGKGSFKEGLEVEKNALSTLGVGTEAIEIRDGSGISHVNLVPANEMTKMLYHVQEMEWFPTFLSSLPLAGSKEKMIGGTLRNRLKNVPMKENVKAKTGTLTNVSSLSGYVKTKSGDTLIFSILLNHLRDNIEGKQIEEQIVNILANIEM
jgi:D-alanyl-D-alanine carboxypeptidase/D-alanyl-D-alanine-endopeptidase (penicillin-binding protein 4)